MINKIMLLVRGNDKVDTALNKTNRFIDIKRSKFNLANDFITKL